jgi:hypothetical protein
MDMDETVCFFGEIDDPGDVRVGTGVGRVRTESYSNPVLIAVPMLEGPEIFVGSSVFASLVH